LSKKQEIFKLESFKQILDSTINDYKIETNIAAEMCILIPFESSNKLPNILNNIEKSKQEMGIDGYGISSPTIEEVFIK
jgi:hypothetical protein